MEQKRTFTFGDFRLHSDSSVFPAMFCNIIMDMSLSFFIQDIEMNNRINMQPYLII